MAKGAADGDNFAELEGTDEAREQIWASLLGGHGKDSDRRRLRAQLLGASEDAAEEEGAFEFEQVLEDSGSGRDSKPVRKIAAPEGLEMARARRQAIRMGGGAMKSAVMEREMKRLERQAASDDLKEEEKREDIMLRHNKASEYVQGRLTQRSGFFTRAF